MKGLPESEWHEGDMPSRRWEEEFQDIRATVDSLVSSGADWFEAEYRSSDGPSIIRRTTEGDYIIEVSAIPKGTTLRGSFRILGLEEEEALDIIDEFDSPAITTQDFSEEIGCPDSFAREYLHDLFDRGIIEQREAGDTELWWIDKDTELNIPNSLQSVLEMHKEGDETIAEAYSRFRGTPSPELLVDIVGEPSGVVDTMREAIRAKGERGIERRKEIRERIDDT